MQGGAPPSSAPVDQTEIYDAGRLTRVNPNDSKREWHNTVCRLNISAPICRYTTCQYDNSKGDLNATGGISTATLVAMRMTE